MLLNAVKDVTMALGDLIHATKAASGKSLNDPAMTTLKESAKVSTVFRVVSLTLYPLILRETGWLNFQTFWFESFSRHAICGLFAHLDNNFSSVPE